MYNVLDYLKSSAEKYDSKIAIIEEDKSITYSDFNDRCKRVGSFLGSRSFFNEPVIIFMDKGIDTLTAFFGVVYAGCFYCLVNPELPANRIGLIREALNSRVVINDEVLEAAAIKHIDTDPLYINFTSGSTGVPKGVVIAHRSVIEFIDIFTELFNFKNEDIIANLL